MIKLFERIKTFDTPFSCDRVYPIADGIMKARSVRTTARQVGVGGLGIAAVTSICYPLHLDLTIAAFLYLLVVVLQSPAGGFASSAIVSTMAALCLDFFFTPPVLKLEIASPLDGVALFTYLATSLIVTRFASQARQKARVAERKQEAFARLYETTWRLYSVAPQAVSGRETLRIFFEVINVEGSACSMLTPGSWKSRATRAAVWQRGPETRTIRAVNMRTARRGPPSGVCMLAGGGLGRLVSRALPTPNRWPRLYPCWPARRWNGRCSFKPPAPRPRRHRQRYCVRRHSRDQGVDASTA